MTPEQFKQARIKLGLTQYEIAKKLGYTTTTIGNWEQDINPVPFVVRLALSALNAGLKPYGDE